MVPADQRDAIAGFLDRLSYVPLDLNEPRSFAALSAALGDRAGRPLATFLSTAPSLFRPADGGPEQGRRGRQEGRQWPAGTIAQRSRERGERARFVQIERHVGQAIEEARYGIALIGRHHLGQRLPRQRAEAGLVLVAARGAEDPEIVRHEPIEVQPEQRRQQHPLGEIAGRAEQDERLGRRRHRSPHRLIGVET